MLLSVLNYAGIAVFAASGALIGVRKRLDVFGVWTMAVLTALGGGVARDVLIGVTPPTSFQSWQNLTVATVAGALVFVLHPQFAVLRGSVLVLDAVGMGVFASTGALTALHHGVSPYGSALVGITTALGGGVLRDILVNEVPLLLQQRDLYAIPALSGAAATVAAYQWGATESRALIAGAVLATAFRLVALWQGWRVPVAPEDLAGRIGRAVRRVFRR
ncbi:trimeric intracellular cation channel family protein [Tsukamurella sp. 8F]|uniref:trimeric intracellular cation channel family protein n=1 Tax=unclassified Tsukamurella TaxID=2633480 RepID=UPI0023B94407|nr:MULTISPECIES: trimeric intracellular cation channel family protein [unclassified Tsukamurella]MDF0532595.1 trimeric intracellular cation channel family protein [Tsukamurella sp. 8J]MDF0589395.1 trimeric intracellular cation channel family protein [Tsukamurella sp. 8F]